MRKILSGGNAAASADVISGVVVFVPARSFFFPCVDLRRSNQSTRLDVLFNSVTLLVQRRHYSTERITESKFRNVTENTLADTPSGYIHDPANYPKRMVTYDKITTEGQAALELIEREYDLMQREELAYSGYTTIPIQEWKEIVFKNTSTREELEFACTNLQNTLNELVGMIGCKVVKKSSRPILPLSIETYEGEENEKLLEDVVVISEDDCNHLRYIIALALRRLGDYEKAESLCLNVLSLDHLNCDALESLIEIYTGTEQPKKLRELFDKIHCWGNEEEEAAMKLRETEIMEEGTSSKHNGKSSSVLDMAMILLSDMITEAGSLHYIESGEGSTTRFFSEAVSLLIAAMGSQYTSLFFESLFRSMDEQHFAARLESSLIKSSEHVVGVVISFLKMLLARNYYELVEDPVRFEFHILSKLHSALRYAERKHESYKICERLIKLYREKSGKYELPSGKRISENSQGPLEDLEPTYKLALFQFVEDRGVDSLIVGKRLCIQAIEEFPEEASPWKTLALILHKEDHINGLSNAVVAAKRAFSLEPKNLSIVLLLANLYKAQKRYQLYEAMMDRYRLLNYLIENDASDKDMKATLEEIRDIDELHPHEKEPDDVEVQFAEMREYMGRMEMANTYSMAVDKEPRVFNQQPVSAPILEPSICEDIPIRPKNIRNVS